MVKVKGPQGGNPNHKKPQKNVTKPGGIVKAKNKVNGKNSAPAGFKQFGKDKNLAVQKNKGGLQQKNKNEKPQINVKKNKAKNHINGNSGPNPKDAQNKQAKVQKTENKKENKAIKALSNLKDAVPPAPFGKKTQAAKSVSNKPKTPTPPQVNGNKQNVPKEAHNLPKEANAAKEKKEKKNKQNKKAMKKSKRETETEGSAPNFVVDSKGKKESEGLPEGAPFNEAEFRKIIAAPNVKKAVVGLQKLVRKASEKMKNKVFSDYKYLLNLTYFKVPNCPKRIVKLHLAHPLHHPEEDDVCFIVRDLKRGMKHDYETSKEKYEEMLREAGVTCIKAVIPFNQLKKEYGSYEMKLKLRNTYDGVLCDGAIIGQVVGFLGKKFQKRVPIPVRMNTKNLAREIKTAMNRTSYKQGQKGSLISIPIGTDKMSVDQLTDNIVKIIEQLKEVYVGGYENIRSMQVRSNIASTQSVPIYVSLCRPPEKTPFVIGPKEEKLMKIEASTKEGLSKFQITSEGKVVKASGKRTNSEEIGDNVPKSKKAKKEENESESKVEFQVEKSQTLKVPVTKSELKEKAANKNEKLVNAKKKNTLLSKQESISSNEEEDVGDDDSESVSDDNEEEDDSLDESDIDINSAEQVLKEALAKSNKSKVGTETAKKTKENELVKQKGKLAIANQAESTDGEDEDISDDDEEDDDDDDEEDDEDDDDDDDDEDDDDERDDDDEEDDDDDDDEDGDDDDDEDESD